jgi:membrane protease YdiL (CAAX protease family)
MKELFHKEYCSKCGQAFDPARRTCPKCGQASAYAGKTRTWQESIPLGPGKEIACFLMGWAGFQVIATMMQLFVISIFKSSLVTAGFSTEAISANLDSFTASGAYMASVFFPAYLILFCVLLSVLSKDLPRLSAAFKSPKTYLGIACGVGIILLVSLYGLATASLKTATNANESNIETTVTASPSYAVLSIFIFGLVGPFCEEVTYRLGLFNFLKRWSLVAAYILSALIFAFIHFDWTNAGSAVEWLSFPAYLLSGLAFALTYEYFGFGASFLAHATNNLVDLVMIIIAANLPQ